MSHAPSFTQVVLAIGIVFLLLVTITVIYLDVRQQKEHARVVLEMNHRWEEDMARRSYDSRPISEVLDHPYAAGDLEAARHDEDADFRRRREEEARWDARWDAEARRNALRDQGGAS